MPNRPVDDWMWQRACELLDEADRRTRQFFAVTRDHMEYAWQPPIDVYQQDQDLVVWAAMPGVPPESIEVVLQGRILRIVGSRPLVESRTAVIRRLEIPYGRFERRLEIPEEGYVVVQQEVLHGCLRLKLHHE